MPLLSDAGVIRGILRDYASRQIAIPAFCAENTYTMEGVLMGAERTARALGVARLPLFVSVTAHYHGRQQLRHYTSLDDIGEGWRAFRSDLTRLGRDGGPFPHVVAIPMIDHGQPGLDDAIFEDGRGFLGSVMYDASSLPLARNREQTAAFVERHRDAFVIEGCVDEITESGDGGMHLTEPDAAERFLNDTGVDLMVVNLGTEHRAASGKRRYHGELARAIRDRVGHRLVLHGTSCLSSEDLERLRGDGIAKVNIWTVLEVAGAQRLAAMIVRNIAHMLPHEDLDELVAEGWLGARTGSAQAHPDLDYLTEVFRRTTVKTATIVELVERFLRVFGYGDLAAPPTP